MATRTLLSGGLSRLRTLGVSLSPHLTRHPVQWRHMTTALPAAGILPLEGVRVLDMTRVLAGVSIVKSIAVVCIHALII